MCHGRHELDHRKQAVTPAHVADDGVLRGEALELFAQHRPESPRPVDQPVLAVRVDRRRAGGAGQRMAAVRKARVEHPVVETSRDLARSTTAAPRGSTRRSSPFARVITSGRPASP